MVHGTSVIPIPFHWSACPGQDWWWFGIHQGIDVVCCRLTHSAFEPGTSSSVTFKTYIFAWRNCTVRSFQEFSVDGSDVCTQIQFFHQLFIALYGPSVK